MPWVKDYYGILGCAPDADPVVVRAAWKALLTKYHPDLDRTDEAARKLALVNEAWSVLGGGETRAAYDEALRAPGALGRRQVMTSQARAAAPRSGLRRRRRSGAAAMFGSVAVGTFALAAALATFYSPEDVRERADPNLTALRSQAEAEARGFDIRRLSTLTSDLAERRGVADAARMSRAERRRGNCVLIAGADALGDAREVCPSLGLVASCDDGRGSCRADP